MLRGVATTRLAHSLLALAALSLPSCATLPSELAEDGPFVVAVKCARLPEHMPWYSTFAEHSWFDVRNDVGWTRIEVISRSSGVRVRRIPASEARSDERWGGRQVHVLAVYTGEDAKQLVPAMLAKAKTYPHALGYQPWPGPNSNTFVEWLSREVSGLAVAQYPTSLGKDYPRNGWVDAGITATRTGLELETAYVGLQAGLIEGVELHLVGLTIGVGLWPPQLKVPFLPGLPWGLAH